MSREFHWPPFCRAKSNVEEVGHDVVATYVSHDLMHTSREPYVFAKRRRHRQACIKCIYSV